MVPGAPLGEDLTILGLLGEGGTGLVYRAHHRVLKREVAVKMCHRSLPMGNELARRLVQEARMCASVRDPRVPRIYGLDRLEDGTPYLVMEMAHGEPLSKLLEVARLHPRVACELACELLRALDAVHRARVIHRDIKPSNVIVALDDEEPKRPPLRLLDFGIGKPLGNSRDDLVLTRPGSVVGTPMYMAPEQMIEGAIDQRVDVYSAGVVLFEMLAGRPPFRAPSVAETFVAVLHDEMPKLGTLCPSLPSSLVAVVERAAARKPDDRFESASAMLSALAEAQRELPPRAPNEPKFQQGEEQSPTLVWQRDGADQSNERRCYGRPLPASWIHTLRPANRKDRRQGGLSSKGPIGFLSPPSPAARAVGGWRVVPGGL